MFTVIGITGKVGGAVARVLLDAGLPVRAVVRLRPRAHRGWRVVANSRSLRRVVRARLSLSALRSGQAQLCLDNTIAQKLAGYEIDLASTNFYSVSHCWGGLGDNFLLKQVVEAECTRSSCITGPSFVRPISEHCSKT
jgi:hypothetical protein